MSMVKRLLKYSHDKNRCTLLYSELTLQSWIILRYFWIILRLIYCLRCVIFGKSLNYVIFDQIFCFAESYAGNKAIPHRAVSGNLAN